MVQKMIASLPKTGKDERNNKAMSGADVLNTLRPQFAAAELASFTEIVKCETTFEVRGEKQTRTMCANVTVQLTLLCTDTGYERSWKMPAYAEHPGGTRAIQMATTTATRLILANTFNFCGEDPIQQQQRNNYGRPQPPQSHGNGNNTGTGLSEVQVTRFKDTAKANGLVGVGYQNLLTAFKVIDVSLIKPEEYPKLMAKAQSKEEMQAYNEGKKTIQVFYGIDNKLNINIAQQ